MSDDYIAANVPGGWIMEKDAEIDRLREEAKIFREGFDGLTRGNQELQRQILSQYAVIDEMITTKGKLLKALQSIAIIKDEKKARAIAFEVLDELYGDI